MTNFVEFCRKLANGEFTQEDLALMEAMRQFIDRDFVLPKPSQDIGEDEPCA